MSFSPDGERLYTGTETGDVIVIAVRNKAIMFAQPSFEFFFQINFIVVMLVEFYLCQSLQIRLILKMVVLF